MWPFMVGGAEIKDIFCKDLLGKCRFSTTISFEDNYFISNGSLGSNMSTVFRENPAPRDGRKSI